MTQFLDALAAVFTILYPFWPLIILFGVGSMRRDDLHLHQRIFRAIGTIFITWVVWAFLWGFILLRGQQPMLILPVRLNNPAFFVVGGISGGVLWARMMWRWGEVRVMLARARKLENLKSLPPAEFEALVAKLFETYGHDVERVGGQSDHGVDIVVRTDQGEKWIVQCKRYRGSVGEPVLRDLYGTMLHEAAQGAYLMTTGTFTQGARVWASEKPIILYDGEGLIKLFRMINP